MVMKLCIILFALALHVEVNGDNPDTFLEVPGMIVHDGYPQETYRVMTEDGYALTVHRIPHGRGVGNCTDCDKPVVVLDHGLFGSSSNWIFAGVNSALGYMLADRNYDVWMPNTRGNVYSTIYTPRRDPRTKEFWDFSWHEGGIYDMPATIDYILEKTGKKKIFYVGHSMGTTMFYVMMSQRPEYNDKVAAMVSLAPIAFVNHARIGLLSVFADHSSLVNSLLDLIGLTQLKPMSHMLSKIVTTLCFETPMISDVCQKLIISVFGFDLIGLNQTLIPVYFNNMFSGSSTKQIMHYAQIFKSGRFCQYDYGLIDNLIRYHSIHPPSYNISEVKIPVALFYADGDKFGDVIDVKKLYKKLPNVIKLFKVPYSGFSHQDFVTHKYIATLVNKPIIDIFESYT
ncbi:lipase 3-like [Periplaneta americana]|uniref:lipase 3-like n=1 Tax=Periplaneta americana TaxID=6978 RepID=UPI0037E9050D